MIMKYSYYNLVYYDDQYSYWFNTLHRTFFRLSRELGHKLEGFSANLASLKSECYDIYKKLVNSGFIVPRNTNELELFKQENSKAIHSKDYFLIVLPTLNCNFSCWYCIQKHVESIMPKSVLERLKRHIDYAIDTCNITSLQIEWFGGEPFMYFKQIIIPLSLYAIAKCKQKNIPFLNSTTTNGFYLNENVSKSLQELEFQSFQITLDGEQKYHDKVKHQKNCSSAFKHVLSNINKCLTINSEIVVYLRINYTHKNLTKEIVEQVNEFIEPTNRKRIIIRMKKVWQEKTDKSFSSQISYIQSLFANAGYRIEYFEPLPFYSCYTNKEYYNAVNFNGNIVKCTACNDLYDSITEGKLLDNGEIAWNKPRSQYQCISYENAKCLACKKLPICMGVCPHDFIDGINICKYEAEEFDFKTAIINYINQAYEK